MSARVAGEYRSRGAGRDTPTPARRMLAQEMHEQGVTLADIGRVFGVSQEAVRHWIRGKRAVYLTEAEIALVLQYREKMRSTE